MVDDLDRDLRSLKIDRSARSTGIGRSVVVWLVGVALLVGFAAWAWPELEAKMLPEVGATEVTRMLPSTTSVELTAAGYVQADITTNLTSKVPGHIARVLVQQGQRVERGSVLLELDPKEEEAAIATAESEVTAALAQANSVQARRQVVEAQLGEALLKAERERHLADQRAVGFATAEDLEAHAASLRQAVQAAEAEERAAVARAATSRSRVNMAKAALGNLTLVAPISGTIITRPPEVGEYVGPQAVGAPVATGGIRIADLSTLLVEVDIPEARLSRVKPGGSVEIMLDAYPDRRFRGRVKEITPEVDRHKATVKVRVEFVEEAAGVLPDMSARVSFLSRELNVGVPGEVRKEVVPGTAVVEREGVRVVFVVEEDGTVRMTPVKLGQQFGGAFELLAGPAAGTQLVNRPPATLANGQRVKASP